MTVGMTVDMAVHMAADAEAAEKSWAESWVGVGVSQQPSCAACSGRSAWPVDTAALVGGCGG
jgi:hypothetical protein